MINKDSVKLVISEKEQAISALVNSGAIPPIGQITDAETSILIILHQQNVNQEQTNLKLFEKLDKAAEEAKRASDKAEVAADGVIEIKNQFIDLNGKTRATIERVTSLEGIKELAIKEEEKRALIRQGMRVIPAKLYDFLTMAGQLLLGILAITGAFGSIWWIIIQVIDHVK